MSKPSIYGLENCDTCKRTRKWLTEAGVEYTFIDYKRVPVTADKLKSWAKELGWPALINRNGSTWRNLLSSRKNPGTDAEYVLLIRENPSLMRRPLLVMGKQIKLGFSHGFYEKLFLTASSDT